MKFGEWQFCKFYEQCSPLKLHCRRSFFGVLGMPVAALGFTLAWRRPRHVFLLLPWPPYKAQTSSPFFLPLPLFSRRHRRYSSEPASLP